MKIESQVYSRYLTEIPTSRSQKAENKEIQKNRPNAVAKSSSHRSQAVTSHKIDPKKGQSASFAAKKSGIPSTLNDVITPEERAMLRQLFPEKGARWGKSAYEAANYSLSDLALGGKLDLMS